MKILYVCLSISDLRTVVGRLKSSDVLVTFSEYRNNGLLSGLKNTKFFEDYSKNFKNLDNCPEDFDGYDHTNNNLHFLLLNHPPNLLPLNNQNISY